MPCRLAFPHPRDVLDRMLVKVVLSYYMEGEHSQGVNNPRVLGSGGKVRLVELAAVPAVEARALALDSA